MLPLKKLSPIFISGAIFGLVIWQIEPPQSLTKASFLQMVLFFVPLFLSLIFTFDLIFRFYLKSFIISLSIVIILILKTLDTLNLVTLALTFVATFLITKSLKQPKKSYLSKIPKLSHLQKQK